MDIDENQRDKDRDDNFKRFEIETKLKMENISPKKEETLKKIDNAQELELKK